MKHDVQGQIWFDHEMINIIIFLAGVFFFFWYWGYKPNNGFVFTSSLHFLFYSAAIAGYQRASPAPNATISFKDRGDNYGDAYAVNSSAICEPIPAVGLFSTCYATFEIIAGSSSLAIGGDHFDGSLFSQSITSWKSPKKGHTRILINLQDHQKKQPHGLKSVSSDCATLSRVRADSQRLFAHGLLPGFTLDNH